jgi:hypothetical protein
MNVEHGAAEIPHRDRLASPDELAGWRCHPSSAGTRSARPYAWAPRSLSSTPPVRVAVSAVSNGATPQNPSPSSVPALAGNSPAPARSKE